MRIVTFCDDCPNKSHFCLLYFSAKHRFMQGQLLNTRVAAHSNISEIVDSIIFLLCCYFFMAHCHSELIPCINETHVNDCGRLATVATRLLLIKCGHNV